MGKRFHVAMFCAEEAFGERQAFYSATFGAPCYEGSINEGADGRSYYASIWNRSEGLTFALLRNPALTSPNEQLAHLGLIFDDRSEFDAEIQRRDIAPEKIGTLSRGERQVFVREKSGVEWEISCSMTDS